MPGRYPDPVAFGLRLGPVSPVPRWISPNPLSLGNCFRCDSSCGEAFRGKDRSFLSDAFRSSSQGLTPTSPFVLGVHAPREDSSFDPMVAFRGHRRFFRLRLAPQLYSSPSALLGLPSIAFRLRHVFEDRAPNREASSYFRRYLAPFFSKPPCRQNVRRASSSPAGRFARRFVFVPHRNASSSPAPFFWSTRREGNFPRRCTQ